MAGKCVWSKTIAQVVAQLVVQKKEKRALSHAQKREAFRLSAESKEDAVVDNSLPLSSSFVADETYQEIETAEQDLVVVLANGSAGAENETIGLGSIVEIRDNRNGPRTVICVSAYGGNDIPLGKGAIAQAIMLMSDRSPIGGCLIGKRAGETFTVPDNGLSVKIERVIISD
jgi:transcription elongation GreA/GreB family factor